MLTPSITLPKPHLFGKTVRLLSIAFAALLIIFLFVSGWLYTSARGALPQLDGEESVSGLQGSVTVVRDSHGVPTVSAGSLEDLFFAQGYVTAQDRLWQMDMTRRFASGRLAEVMGSSALKSDIRQRTLLVPESAERAAALISGRDRVFLEAYARGVNAFIESHRGKLPIEFRILHYSPEPWTIVDSMLVGASMSEMLNLDTLQTTLSREAITAKIGPELATDLYPNASFRDRPPVPEPEAEGDSPRDAGKRETGKAHDGGTAMPNFASPVGIPLGDDLDVLPPGSNNWAVSGAHTVSGKPLLSNDMHLPHQIPNTWYEIHLTSGDFDVAGVSLPGVPFVIVGHNQRIAWGFTNLGPAVTDLYVEQVKDDQYLTAQGWKPLEHRRAKIAVRWHKDVKIDVPVTRHGPIVSGLVPGERRSLALKWVLYDPAASQVPFFDVNSARNWDEFRRAFSRFGSPGQNVVYADVDGHIGYQATGFVPMRPWTEVTTSPEGREGDITGTKSQVSYTGLPVPGWDDSHEWSGYVPYEKLPSVLDPESGVIATANGRVTPSGYPYLISAQWGPAYRTERIYRVLGNNKKLSSGDMLALQSDVDSDFDRFCAQRFVYAIDRTANASVRARQAAEIMRGWNGKVTVDSAGAAIVFASRRELVRLMLEPKLGEAYTRYRWFMSSVWLENTMLMQPARWLPERYPSFDALLSDAVEKAVGGEDAPRKLSGWNWGRMSHVTIQHPLFRYVPLLRRWTGPGTQVQSGNGYTVKQVGQAFGPSERMTVDFSDMNASTLNIVTGQSGQLFSRFYMDQWNAWYSGTTFSLPFTPEAVQMNANHRLVLKPK